MFEIPSDPDIKSVRITKEVVNEGVKGRWFPRVKKKRLHKKANLRKGGVGGGEGGGLPI